MTTLYLVRHAEAEGNLYRIVQGQGNSNLTDRGWRQVKALEQRFAQIPIDAVYASDLYRTCATASAVYRPKRLPLQRRKALREIYVGDWEQQTWGDIARTAPEKMAQFSRQPHLWHINGAETAQQVLARVKAELLNIAAENDGRTVAVFSHGYAIRLLLADLQGIPMERVGETPTGQNTAVSLLEYENGQIRVVFRDNIDHLQASGYTEKEILRKKSDPLAPGLWFRPPCLPEDGTLLQTLGEEMATASDCVDGVNTLLCFFKEQPVGILQLGPKAGQIHRIYIRQEFRCRGFGVQLIGQAVQWTRQQGGEALEIALPENTETERFWREYGFAPVPQSGSTVWVKDIRFDPEILALGLQ